MGEGPGEFADPKQLLLHGDTLVVWDASRFRMNLFSLDGKLLRDWAVERPVKMEFGTPSIITNGWLLSDLTVLTQLRDLTPRNSIATGITRPRQHAVQQIASGGWDTLATFVGDEEARVVRERPAGDEPASVVSLPIRGPHGRRSVVAVGGTPSRVCLGEQNDWEVTCFDRGASETRLRWEAAPVKVTVAEVEAWLESMAPAQAGMLGSEEQSRAALSAIPIPEFRPPYGDLWIDNVGNLWTQVPSALNESTSGGLYRVFSPEGKWIGEVQVPEIRFLEVGDDYVLGLARDEFDVEYVRLYQLGKQDHPARP
jgi:hypothetical protein